MDLPELEPEIKFQTQDDFVVNGNDKTAITFGSTTKKEEAEAEEKAKYDALVLETLEMDPIHDIIESKAEEITNQQETSVEEQGAQDDSIEKNNNIEKLEEIERNIEELKEETA